MHLGCFTFPRPPCSLPPLPVKNVGIMLGGCFGLEIITRLLPRGCEFIRQVEEAGGAQPCAGCVLQPASVCAEWARFLSHNPSIQRYAVIPLSTNSGLIGWVPHCDTLHALIRDYREKKKILLNIEHRIMLRVCDEAAKPSALTPTPKLRNLNAAARRSSVCTTPKNLFGRIVY